MKRTKKVWLCQEEPSVERFEHVPDVLRKVLTMVLERSVERSKPLNFLFPDDRATLQSDLRAGLRLRHEGLSVDSNPQRPLAFFMPQTQSVKLALTLGRCSHAG